MCKNAQTILILLTAMNLRLAVTAVTPLFGTIQHALHVSGTLPALLVTIPLLCFAGGAMVTPHLSRQVGIKPLLLITNGLLIGANLCRPSSPGALVLGTLLIGGAIAVLNVLIPIMIAQTTTTPTAVSRLTSAYSVIMNGLAAGGTAAAIPLARWLGWATVLRLFALPAVVGLLAALVTPAIATPPTTTSQPPVFTLLRHDRQARVLTLFMGLQSLIFYSLVTWLPTIFQTLGATADQAGQLLAAFQFVGIPAALVLNRVTNDRWLLTILAGGYLLGMLSLGWSGLGWWLAALLLGFTCSLIFSTALTWIATSSPVTNQVAARSAVAQSLGYLLAAVGPVVFGRLHEWGHSWSPVLLSFLVLMGLTIAVGARVLRQRR